MKSSAAYYYRLLLLIAVLCSFSCKLTDKAATGTWLSSPYSDTLVINEDHHFQLRSASGSKLSGQWKADGKRLDFLFEPGIAGLFGDCKSLQSRHGFLSKRLLIRPSTCNTPTHHFVVFKRMQ